MKALFRCVCMMMSLGLCLSGCVAKRIKAPQVAVRDSVAIKVQYRLEWRKGMVDVNIPDIRETNITRDTTSHLENDYAESDASYSGGVLSHSLYTKPQTKAVETTIPTERVDSTIYKYEYIKTIQEVAMPLSWWQETQIKGFRAMLAILAIVVAWKLFRSKFGGLLGSILKIFK